ncbi:MAG TPA: hypothetical protein VLE23_17930 [Geminicoccaceae bacterium]|nr:hypothetical protein [Geminicoccaceae bacterium]
MTEPDVSLTDYALAAECALFACLLCFRHRPASRVRLWFALLFASLGLASLFGGTVHGFFLDQASVGHRVLWPAAMLAIGGATFAAWLAGAAVLLSRRAIRIVGMAALAQFVVYGGFVLAGAHDFTVAVMNYLPASIFLLAVFAVSYARGQAGWVLIGLVGIVSTFIAAGVQQAGLAVHPVYFNHNALYHLIQGLALFLIFGSIPAVAAAEATKRPQC